MRPCTTTIRRSTRWGAHCCAAATRGRPPPGSACSTARHGRCQRIGRWWAIMRWRRVDDWTDSEMNMTRQLIVLLVLLLGLGALHTAGAHLPLATRPAASKDPHAWLGT